MSEEITELVFANGTKITWERGLDGGGSTQYLDFLPYLNRINRKYTSGLEWCSGLGAIGFSILDAGICDRMSFMDFYPPAAPCTLANARDNGLTSKVVHYTIDQIQKIPLGVKFDLVVGNPPHCQNVPQHIQDVNPYAVRMLLDENWDIHREFFNNIGKYLYKGADIIISEVYDNHDLIQLAKQAGLTYVASVPAQELVKNSNPNSVIMHFQFN